MYICSENKKFKVMKKILSFILLALLSVAKIHATIYYSYNTEINGLYYQLDTNTGTAKLSWMVKVFGPGGESYGGGDYSGHIVIPEYVEYDGITYQVTGIDHDTFCTDLESLTIPASIQSIHGWAIPYSSLSINIKKIIIPNWDWWFSIEKPGKWSDYLLDYTANDFLGKAKIIVANGEEYDINKFTFPEGTTIVPKDAFWACKKLKTVILPYSLKEIGSHAFYGTSLSSVELPTGLESIQSNAFAYCPELLELVIPENVTTLGTSIIDGCSSLRSLTLGCNVRLENDIFGDHAPTSLITIVSNIIHPTDLHRDYFTYYYDTATLYVPMGTKSLYQNCEGWKRFKNIKEGNPITTIDKPLYQKDIIIKKVPYGIIISGATQGTLLMVYLPNGKIIYETALNSGENDIILPSNQLYIVKVGQQVSKLFVK